MLQPRLSSRMLRAGTYTAAMPEMGNYTLPHRVTAGRRQWRHRLFAAYAKCPLATASTDWLKLVAPTAAPGGTLDYDFVNTGDGCSMTGASVRHRTTAGRRQLGACDPGLPLPGHRVPGRARQDEAQAGAPPAGRRPRRLPPARARVAASFAVTP